MGARFHPGAWAMRLEQRRAAREAPHPNVVLAPDKPLVAAVATVVPEAQVELASTPATPATPALPTTPPQPAQEEPVAEPTESRRATLPLTGVRSDAATASEPIHDLVTEAAPDAAVLALAPPAESAQPDPNAAPPAPGSSFVTDAIDWARPAPESPPAPGVSPEPIATPLIATQLRADVADEPRGPEEPSVIVAPELNDPASQPMQSFFSGEVAAISDDESLLPFFVPTPGDAGTQGARPAEAPVPPPPWFERFFDAEYLVYEPQPSEKLTRREGEFIVGSLGLADGARILDLACGTGRHAVELAARGYQVVGLDSSTVMLEHAATRSRSRKVAVDFVHGDMRALAFRRFFDAVLCWGTSFGYFRDVENALVLRKIAHALRPGGRLLLQVVNRDFVLRDVPRTWWRREGDALILDEVDFDPRGARFRQRRSVLRADGRERVDMVDLRGYALSELLSMLGAEGFVPLEISGRITTRGVFLGAESPHITLLAELR